MESNFDPAKTCCFTGHRPDKCKGTEETIRLKLKKEIVNAIGAGYDTFITGMAPGVDTWAAEEILKIKAENSAIRLIAAVPFPGVEKDRDAELRERFKTILDNADCVHYVCPGFRRWAFHARDAWMVDRSSLVIAVFNGSHGGTEWTVNYAKKKNLAVALINDELTAGEDNRPAEDLPQ